MRDGPPCLHCGLRHPRRAPCISVLPAPELFGAGLRIEAEREAHIRADERARVLTEIGADLAAAGYRHDQGHGPSYPPEPGDVPGIVRDVLARLARAEARTERLEAIVRELAEEDDVELHPVTGRVRCRRCRRGAVGGYIDHRPDCPWLRARQEVGDGP